MDLKNDVKDRAKHGLKGIQCQKKTIFTGGCWCEILRIIGKWCLALGDLNF